MRQRDAVSVLLWLVLWISLPALAAEPVLGRCEGCEAVFDGLPVTLSAEARIGTTETPGEALTLSGTVFDASGQPAAGTVVYAYQTDAGGRYPPDPSRGTAGSRHGLLHAWVRADAEGHYRFHSIRPGAYPGQDIPQHIHLHVIEPGRCTYYIGDVLFRDDPLLDAARIAGEARAPGGSGVVRPEGDAIRGWTVRRDIHLGRHLDHYADCGAR